MSARSRERHANAVARVQADYDPSVLFTCRQCGREANRLAFGTSNGKRRERCYCCVSTERLNRAERNQPPAKQGRQLRNLAPRPCGFCGKKMVLDLPVSRAAKRKYCSQPCFHAAQKKTNRKKTRR